MKILITGANGYLGRGIVESVLELGHEVVATDFSTDLVDNRAECINSDLFTIEDPYEHFGQPDVLLHLAWRDGFVHNSDHHLGDLPKHHKFLEKFFKSPIEYISVMGTMHEVGFYEGSIDEDSCCKPLSLYGIAKNALRLDVQRMAKENDKPYQWLRAYYIVGNTSYGCSIFSKIMQAAEEGKKEFPFTMGQNQFDFLDFPDFCNYVASVVTQDQVMDIINICSGKPEKLADRVERFISENNLELKLQYGVFPDRPYDSKAVWGNSNKLDKILNI